MKNVCYVHHKNFLIFEQRLKSVSILNFHQHWFGEKCVRLYLLGYVSISVFTAQNFRIKEKNENLF
jgi:hypothetical protein